jgi:hypothetical protein
MSATFPESVPAFSILASAAAAISAYFLGAVMGDLIFGEEADERNCPRGGVLSMVRLGAARAAFMTVQ